MSARPCHLWNGTPTSRSACRPRAAARPASRAPPPPCSTHRVPSAPASLEGGSPRRHTLYVRRLRCACTPVYVQLTRNMTASPAILCSERRSAHRACTARRPEHSVASRASSHRLAERSKRIYVLFRGFLEQSPRHASVQGSRRRGAALRDVVHAFPCKHATR